MSYFKRTVMALLLAGCSFAAFAQVLTNKATELRVAPDDNARVIQTLANRTEVKVVVRQGAWQQVKVGNDTGWVRMMHLRGGSSVVAEEQSPNSGFLAAFTRLLSGSNSGTGVRTSQRAQSATVGIRGFSRADVEAAEFNPAEFEKLKRFQTGDAEARRIASQGRLAFRSVAYLAQDAVEAATTQGARK
ncbi:MAG: SH3 domain-containing protein [Betaproteobacteria bacterium]|nr:SH3 domain-containing protein [Betaproteobacteria bacterium]